MKRVLVTGASGFIGRHLVQSLLESGHEVACLVRPSSRVDHLRAQGVTLLEGDVCQSETLPAAVRGAQVVYHLAGLTKSLSDQRLDEVNRGGVENVARACAAEPNPPALVVVSSLAAAGPSREEQPRTEADPPLPVSCYGRSKRAGEEAAEAWAAQLPVSIVRPPVVLGEGDRDGVALFRPVVRWGIHYVPGGQALRVSVVHADDLASALMLVGERGARIDPKRSGSCHAEGYYFVECGEQPTYEELGRLIARAAGRSSVRVLRVPKTLLFLAAGAAEIGSRAVRRPGIFNFDKVREATAGCWTCSSRVIRQTLGFAPAKSLCERLSQTTGWYRSEGWM